MWVTPYEEFKTDVGLTVLTQWPLTVIKRTPKKDILNKRTEE